VTTLVRSEEIHCGGCTATIEKSLSAMPGVSQVKGDPESKIVTIEHDDSVTVESILEKMDEAGFTAEKVG
jgi:copper chaperone CopZ